MNEAIRSCMRTAVDGPVRPNLADGRLLFSLRECARHLNLELVDYIVARLEAGAARWNEKAKPSDLLTALDHLTSADIAVERSLLGFEFSLQDGPKKLPPHLGYDAWLALRVAETLQPNATIISKKQREMLTAKMETIAA